MTWGSFFPNGLPRIVLVSLFLAVFSAGILPGYLKVGKLSSKVAELEAEKQKLARQLDQTALELVDLGASGQYLINRTLEEEIKNIHNVYGKAVSSYEDLVDLRGGTVKTKSLDELFALALSDLSNKNYSSATATLRVLDKRLDEEKSKLVTVAGSENILVVNTPPAAGYQRQKVKIDSGEFVVDIVSADLNSTRVIVDTASNSTCPNDCPVLSLSEYVNRNGAFAGVNGSYFCPSTYPQCAGKKNSFDTLLMNKNKVYFNSDNNVYSNVPAVIFSGSSARFVQRSLEWGRDTSVDSVIANQPLLVFNNAIVFGGDGDAKHANRGGRSFVGATGSTVYIGVVRNATVAESAKVLHALGVHNALNLDDGGSTALWFGGYKVGPGRNIPNAVLFVRK